MSDAPVTSVTSSARPQPDTGSRPRRRLATVLAVACVLAACTFAALLIWLQGESAEREDLRRDELAVLQAAERFTVTFNTFQADDAEGYIEQVAPLLTTKFRTDFTESATDVATGIQKQQLTSEGQVLVDNDGIPLVGIASLDPDSAEVLVVADANRVANGQAVLRHWRWQISLRKVGGDWLVDSFKEV